MWLNAASIGSELAAYITAVDAIESKIFQNQHQFAHSALAHTNTAAPEPLGSRSSTFPSWNMRFGHLRRAVDRSWQSIARCRRWNGPWRGLS